MSEQAACSYRVWSSHQTFAKVRCNEVVSEVLKYD